MTWYILNEDKTVTKLPEGEYPPEGSYTNDKAKRVGLDIVGEAKVSTVFLFMDHSLNFMRRKKEIDPVLFETMIFRGPYDEYQRRYHTYDEALQGHNNIIKSLEEGKDPDLYFND